MRVGCNDTPLQNIIKAPALELLQIDTIEVTDMYAVEPAVNIFLFEVTHTVERPFYLTCNNAVFKNIVIAGKTFASGDTTPMTVFGNFGSASTFTTMHFYSFDNLDVENFYTVDVADPATIIDGDSDFFRMFNNPSSIAIENLRVVNVAKRFVKSQEECILSVGYLLSTLDNRFTGSGNHIGTFEAQFVNQTKPSRFHIRSADVDYSAVAGNPVFLNASGFPHEFILENTKYQNIAVFGSTENIKLDIANVEGSKLLINAPSSDRVRVRGIKDTGMPRPATVKIHVSGFDITAVSISTNAFFSGAVLENGVFRNWDTGTRIATFYRIKDVKVIYATATIDGRPFFPIPGDRVLAEGVTIDNPTGTSVIYFHQTTGTGTLVIRDFRSNAGQLGFFSGGNWSVFKDNCDSNVVTGAGAVTNATANYA
jgi:hypothetical protein